MILISIILSCITSMHRQYYILPLNYCKNMFTMLFYKGGGGDVAPYQISGGEIFVQGGKPKRPPTQRKTAKRPHLVKKALPRD